MYLLLWFYHCYMLVDPLQIFILVKKHHKRIHNLLFCPNIHRNKTADKQTMEFTNTVVEAERGVKKKYYYFDKHFLCDFSCDLYLQD